MATTPVSVRLDEPLKARVRSLADQRRRPVHWLMREAIEQYVEREEQREAFRKEALDAWEHYQSTGLHVTGAEADAWLAELEAGNDIEPPRAHR
ncbi:MAG TPA: ribbon-helix-helix domain-containing protein [Thauera sp.]|uniref:CopG family ribbon-helix-helix protein n=1 Tax=Thauera sp. TaxID=1905334 RepID=UPI002B96C845|nr:ribbon-helix-helix domain-containing protein [Thauera sp.]HRP26185.1 ribbon-helix-helix domain-containing protein [Thauera sp.]HRP66730.1 ribbon-helix-helix domain-containing protein [Thauera sp.]